MIIKISIECGCPSEAKSILDKLSEEAPVTQVISEPAPLTKDTVTDSVTSVNDLVAEITQKQTEGEIFTDGHGAAPTPDAPAPASAPATGDVELDINGVPWDARIHSTSKKKTKGGIWRRGRGVDDATFTNVMVELKAQTGVPTPHAPVMTPTPPTPPVTPTAPVQQPAATIPAAGPTPPASAPVTPTVPVQQPTAAPTPPPMPVNVPSPVMTEPASTDVSVTDLGTVVSECIRLGHFGAAEVASHYAMAGVDPLQLTSDPNQLRRAYDYFSAKLNQVSAG